LHSHYTSDNNSRRRLVFSIIIKRHSEDDDLYNKNNTNNNNATKMTMGEENKSDSDEGRKSKVLTFKLAKESELRVECKLNRFFHVAVLPNSGTCEIFGSEIGSSSSSALSSSGGLSSSVGGTNATKKKLGGGKWAFFTYSGCTIELEETNQTNANSKIHLTTKKTSGEGAGGEDFGDDTGTRNEDSDDDLEKSGDEEDKDKEEEQAIEIAYVSEETPMVSYLNVHGVLEAKRKKARDCSSALVSSDDAVNEMEKEEEEEDTKKKRKRGEIVEGEEQQEEKENDGVRQKSSAGPRVLIVGPADVGKSSLSKILINYAARQAWSPLFIDLDLGQNAISVPGTISAAPIDHPINPFEDGAHVKSEMPLSYFFGDVTVTENSKEHYKFLVEKIAEMMEARNSKNEHARHSGCIVNTMGWIEGLGLELILHAVKSLEIDTVLCLGQERLFQTLSKQFAKDAALAQQQQQKNKKNKKKTSSSDDDGKKVEAAVEILSLKKSGGVVERTTEFRRKTRDDRFREYFYGFDFVSNPLSPVAQSAFFSSVSFYKVGGGPKAPTSALPIGQEASTDPMRVASVIPSMSLVNAIVAVSHGKTQSDLLTSNVAGFIHIVEVDMHAKRFTYLSPNPGQLPNTNLIVGNVKWFPEN
jgi:polyribonucleotide 5'-hydroxyl-kinase